MRDITTVERLRQYMGTALRGPNWDAVLEAIGRSDDANTALARWAFDQVSIATASGLYLDRRAADFDIFRPVAVGFDDDGFRRFVLAVKNHHMTFAALWNLLECIFGADAVRVHVTGTIPSPYSIRDGDRLRLYAELGDYFDVEFRARDFSDPSFATAEEICQTLNRALRFLDSDIHAVPFWDVERREKYVRIYSGAVGLRGRLEVAPGPIQEALGLPLGHHSFVPGSQRPVLVGLGSSALVRLPATSSILRPAGGATFLPGHRPVAIDSLRATGGTLEIDTTIPHGLAAGDRILVRGISSQPGSSVPVVSPNGKLIDPRSAMTGIRISSGKVLVAGGRKPGNENLGEVLEFDPATNKVSILASLSVPRAKPGACETDGCVYFIGGHTTASGNSDHCDILDLGTGQILPGPSLVVAQQSPGVFALENGDIVAVGFQIIQRLRKGYLEWEKEPSELQPRSYQSTVRLQDGRILVVGGLFTGTAVPTTEIYNPWLRRVDATVDLPRPLGFVGLALLRSGLVFAAGGTHNLSTASQDVFLFDSRTQTWKSVRPMTYGRIAPRVIELEDGRIFVGGGGSAWSPFGEIYDPRTDRWTVTPGIAPEANRDAVFEAVPGGVVMFGGDMGTAETATDEIFRFGAAPGFDLRGVNGSHRVREVVSPTRILVDFSGELELTPTGAELIAETRIETGNGFLHDPAAAPATAHWTRTMTVVGAGQSVREFAVENCSAFADRGWVVLDLGGDRQEGPVPYVLRPTSELLILDPTYRFEMDHPAGTTVTLLADSVPSPPVEPTILTDSTAGSRLARQYIGEISAAGVEVRVETSYPGHRGLAGDHLPIERSDAPWIWGKEE